VDRALTMPEIRARLEEIANPTVRGLAAKSFEESWRKHAEATQGSEADLYVTYPVYDNGVCGSPEHSDLAARRTQAVERRCAQDAHMQGVGVIR
jgi:hypothetical protein